MTGTARNTKAETAQARSKVYALLAEVFRAEPDKALVERMMSPEFREPLGERGYSLGREFDDRTPDQLAEDLAVEYTRLFIGPGPRLSPHESVHRVADNPEEGMLWGTETVKVRRFIQATGLRYEDTFTGMPDHISAELELMQKLAERESEAWGEGAEEDARWCAMVQRRFFDEHLSRWVPEFCAKVADRAEMDFYRDMAVLTRSFLEYERTTAQDHDEAQRQART